MTPFGVTWGPPGQSTSGALLWGVGRQPRGPFPGQLFFGVFMKRYGVNKSRSSKKFRRDVSRTKVPNLVSSPMRGGWRM